MKLFSRKALVAGATAVAVSVAGMSVASAEEPTSSVSNISTLSSDSEGSSLKSNDVKGWIGVVTAIIGAVSALYTLITKIFK